MTPTPVILDVDPGIDDALAIPEAEPLDTAVPEVVSAEEVPEPVAATTSDTTAWPVASVRNDATLRPGPPVRESKSDSSSGRGQGMGSR